MTITEHAFFIFVLFSRDEVEKRLVTEVQALRDNVSALQEMLSEVCSTWNIISDKNVIDLHGCENRIRKYYRFVTINKYIFWFLRLTSSKTNCPL